jgi:hypothetical protein
MRLGKRTGVSWRWEYSGEEHGTMWVAGRTGSLHDIFPDFFMGKFLFMVRSVQRNICSKFGHEISMVIDCYVVVHQMQKLQKLQVRLSSSISPRMKAVRMTCWWGWSRSRCGRGTQVHHLRQVGWCKLTQKIIPVSAHKPINLTCTKCKLRRARILFQLICRCPKVNLLLFAFLNLLFLPFLVILLFLHDKYMLITSCITICKVAPIHCAYNKRNCVRKKIHRELLFLDGDPQIFTHMVFFE